VQQFAVGFTDTKQEAAERSEIADHRKRAGKTVPAKGPTTGKATWAIDGDWSRSCGCVSTILGTIGFGLCRALYRRGNFQFYDASLITGPQPACLLPANPAC
jgi:hypothetical protein